MSVFSRVRNSKPLRAALVILLLAAVFLFPWWTVILLGIVGSVLFSFFWEAVIAGILFDILYGIAHPKFLGFQFVIATAMLVVVVGVTYIKQYIRY